MGVWRVSFLIFRIFGCMWTRLGSRRCKIGVMILVFSVTSFELDALNFFIQPFFAVVKFNVLHWFLLCRGGGTYRLLNPYKQFTNSVYTYITYMPAFRCAVLSLSVVHD